MFCLYTINSLWIFDNMQDIMCTSLLYTVICVRNSGKGGKHFKINEMQKADLHGFFVQSKEKAKINNSLKIQAHIVNSYGILCLPIQLEGKKWSDVI